MASVAAQPPLTPQHPIDRYAIIRSGQSRRAMPRLAAPPARFRDLLAVPRRGQGRHIARGNQ